ncbi:hypothetical protein DFP72DRAFT_1070181 [Ephemerocybe angulata]|uniref:Uncharacterized protein n=1 Tax=Ephemerocybe angulata TaxID=980116 RepID=A0A8H6HVL4_9AGAR|nr:hypothetical protein DFP72DRAFT_1070181 [Tulosesus angulatus]
MALLGLPLFLFVALFAVAARAQDAARPASRQFQWKWKNDGIGFSLATCTQLGVEVKSWDVTKNDTHGIAPYYMMAFPVGGTPVTKYIGNSDTALVWEVSHAPGTKLLLTVVDSTGSFGGVPPRMFDVIAGVSTSCVVPEPTSPTFTISSNITTNRLETCEPWGITIKGGIPPYNLSIAAVNSPVITNVTIPSGFDAFTYINRAEPNGQMIIGVADFTGNWASGVPLVSTYGSENYDCVGLVSSNGVASQLAKEAEDRKKAKDKKRTAIVAGVTVPLVILLLAAIGVGVWWYRRKKQLEKEPNPQDVEPYAYKEEPLQLPQGMYANGTGNSGQSKTAFSMQDSTGPLSYTTHGGGPGSPSIHGSFAAPSSTAYTSHDSPHDTRGGSSIVTFQPNRNLSGKAAEAAQSVVLAPDSEYAHASGSGQQAANGDEIVIQHRDGGTVRELPPPYADRSLG